MYPHISFLRLCCLEHGFLDRLKVLGLLFPAGVEMGEEGVDDTLATGVVEKVSHHPLSSADFAERSLNDIGRANDLANRRWENKDGK